VTSGADSGAGSLRAALASAANGDTITFSSDLTEVVLTSAQLDVATGVTIAGPGADVLTVKRSTAGGTPNFRVFRIVPGAGNTATISGITIANGKGTPGGGVSFTGGVGTQLNLVRVAVTANDAQWGGGIDLAGDQLSSVTIDSSTVSGNTTNGGAACDFCNGGGMKLEVPTVIVNSTISGNAAGDNGGGMKVDSAVTIVNSTIAGNSAGAKGGGIWVTRFNNNPNLAIKNTVVADNTFGPGGLRHECDVDTSSTTLSVNLNNLVEDGSCNFLWASGAVSGSATNFLSGDPGLSALSYNGGPIKTQAIASSSIARGVGNASACAGAPVSGVDQRGESRPSPCSIGAFDGASRPDPPTALIATAGDASASIAFTAGADNGAAISNYEYSTDNGSTWTTRSPASATSPITITGLSNATTYLVKLRAINSAGTSTASNATSVTPAAAPVLTPTPEPVLTPTPVLTPSPKPSNIIPMPKMTTSSSAITSIVVTPGPGALSQVGSSVTNAAALLTLCKASAIATKAGAIKLTCKLSSAARKALRRGAMRVSLVTTFKPTGGTARSTRRTVTLKSQRPK